MRFFSTVVCMAYFLFLCSCLGKYANTGNSNLTKKTPCAILKEYDSLRVQLDINVKTSSLIIAEVTFINKSKNSFFLNKPLLPDSILNEEVFHAFGAKSYQNVIYLGNRVNKYVCNDTGIILLNEIDLISSNFKEIRSNEKLVFRTNVAQYYDFASLVKAGEKEFFITYAVNMPELRNGKQLFEIDPVDKSMKPVYFSLILSGSNVDERRKKFYLTQ